MQNAKYDRNYTLNIETQHLNQIQVRRPFTLEFEIHRNSFSSANVASFRIFNLSKNNRSQIRKDQYTYQDQRKLQFYAGYGNNLSIAFEGNLTQAWSVREGVDFITQIECFDGGFAYNNAVTDEQFPATTEQSTIIDSFVSDLSQFGVSKGAVGAYPGQIGRGNAFTGSSTNLLNEITGGGFFIDNSKAFCLNDNECLQTPVPTINVASGLLGTPILENQFINFDMLFEPGLRIGQLINLQSQSADQFNGTHKIIMIRHRGIISDAVCGNVITSLGLLPGVFKPIPLLGGG